METISQGNGHGEQLTEEEAAVYDRQIRLWGVESQKRLRKANILIAGMDGLGNEVCKNILLAGVNHVTLLDAVELTDENVNGQFLGKRSDMGKNRAEASLERAQRLNPMVDISVDRDEIGNKPKEFFKKFDVVCLFGFPKETLVQVGSYCRAHGVKFFCGGVFGKYGYMFSDLGTHRYLQEKAKIAKASLVGKLEPHSKKARMEDENGEMEMEAKMTEFISFADGLSVDFCRSKTLKQIKGVSKVYFVMQVMLAFSQRYGQYPPASLTAKLWDELVETRNDVMEELQVDNDVLPDDTLSNCIGVLYPVCCIVGGILAQEVIKAVSGKDTPHNNTFFFNGETSAGVVDRIGPS